MALQEELVVKANGLYTYSDKLSEVPEGSLNVAQNIVIDKDGLFSPRRGYAKLDGSITGNILSMHTFTQSGFNYLLAYRENGSDKKLEIYDDGLSSWVTIPTAIQPPTGSATLKTAQANKNLYITSSKGVQKLDSVAGDIVDSGAPEGLDIETADANSGTGTAIPNDATNVQSVAYRVVWGYRDANNNLVLGPPSARIVHNITAATGPSDVDVTITIPAPPVTTNWFVQVYRTAVLTGAGATPGDPGDEMGLVLERNPSAGEITAQEITITDVTPDALRGADLYTNQTQQGILQANYQPPQCKDITLYQNHMFYANTETKYELEVSLLAVDQAGTNTDALTVDDTVVIDGVTYTGKAAENTANDEFLISNSASPADAIADTARSLVKVINKSSNNSTLWAVYASGEDEVPGKIRIYERDFGDATSFTFQCSGRGQAWSPDATSALDSDNDVNPNRVYYSKFQQPEAVPVLNFFDVGAANDQILRILPLRSILLIFTTNGTYKLTGATANSFQVSLLDDTAVLIAPDSLVALNNNAVGLFDQGVSQVSYGSVQVLSRPIEGDLNTIRGNTTSVLSSLTYGISYESDRKYLIGLPIRNSDTQAQIVYVYNLFTQSWTTFDIERRNGIVRKQDDKLYFCSTDEVIEERKDYSDTDFVDPEIDVTVSSVTGTEIQLNTTTGVLVGYQFFESASKYSEILTVDTSNNIITVADDLSWATGAAEIRPYIETIIEWNPITANTPNILKQWSEATLLVNRPITEATIKFKTLASAFYESVMLEDTSNGPWGLFAWGAVPWGGATTVYRYRTWVPRQKQRDSVIVMRLEQNTVFNDFEISGWSLIYRNISQRPTR